MPSPRGILIRSNTQSKANARRATRKHNKPFLNRHASLLPHSPSRRSFNPPRGTRRSIEPRTSSKNRLIHIPLQEAPGKRYSKKSNNFARPIHIRVPLQEAPGKGYPLLSSNRYRSKPFNPLHQ
jgi:hypothetical protein